MGFVQVTFMRKMIKMIKLAAGKEASENDTSEKDMVMMLEHK